MTLIITALSDKAVVQVSDRRLTCNGKIYDDSANKAIYVACRDARFTLAYTGLAKIGGQLTDEWAFDYLSSINAGYLRFPDLFKLFHSHLASTFVNLRYLGWTRRITFAICGFGPRGPFLSMLSNIEDEKGKCLKNIDDSFRSVIYYRNNKAMKKLDIILHGTESSINKNIDITISKIRKRYLNKNPNEVVALLVQLIRRAASHVEFGHYIGRNCMSVLLHQNGDTICQYHPDNASSIQYAPHTILGGQSFKNILISSQKPESW